MKVYYFNDENVPVTIQVNNWQRDPMKWDHIEYVTIQPQSSKLIVLDAEGASKFIQIKVSQAKSFIEARQVALSIANSSLFKTAMYGENPNFGRIASAVGASGIAVKEKDLKMKVGPLNKKYIDVSVSINQGRGSATVYTSDLTCEYIKINAEYN